MGQHRSAGRLASLRTPSFCRSLSLGALALGACSSGDATLLDGDTALDSVAETALGELGSLSLALSNNNGSDEIRLLGTLNVRDAGGAIAATLVAAADSPAAQSVTLQPGAYTIDVLDGYSCTQAGSTPNFTGCTFVGATPNPFEVRGGEQTAVTLELTAHFSRGQDVTTLLRTGTLQLSLQPSTSITVLCGSGPGCTAPQICASVDGGAAQCRTPCASSADCAGLDCVSVFTPGAPAAGSSAPGGVCASPPPPPPPAG